MSVRLLTMLAAFTVVASVFGSFTAGVVFARHYLHVGMDPRFQETPAETGGNTLPENHVNAKWALRGRGEAVTWYARPPIRDHFAEALAKWTAAVPNLRWREVNSSANYDVLVYEDSLCGGLTGFFRVNDWVPSDPRVPAGWHTDNGRSANYWKKAAICLKRNFSSPATDDLPLSRTAHEIGHAYGLHDAYTDNPPTTSPCNNSVTSIMDGPYLKPTGEGSRLAHCDGLTGPSPWDVARVGDFFASGGPADFTSDASGNRGTFRWMDDAWGEARHEMSYLYRLDSEDEDQLWVKYEDGTVIVNTGRHKLIAGVGAIRFREDITLTSHTRGRAFQTLPARTAYQVCGRAFFTQYDRPSGLRCSPVVKVSNAQHNVDAALLRRYDANNNRVIDTSEMLSATADYFAGLISIAEIFVLMRVYFSS